MRIKFIEPDPRAGDFAQMDSQRGVQFIALGAAVRVNEDGSDVVPATVSARAALAIAMANALDGALAALPGNYTDPEYVVSGMRRAFGDLFTAADEAQVRERVLVPATASIAAETVPVGNAVPDPAAGSLADGSEPAASDSAAAADAPVADPDAGTDPDADTASAATKTTRKK